MENRSFEFYTRWIERPFISAWFNVWFNLSIVASYVILTVLMILGNIPGSRNVLFQIWPSLPDLLEWFYLNAWVHMALLLAAVNLLGLSYQKYPEFRVKAKKWIRPFASLKLAVFVIIAVGVVASVGTIIEARYNLEAAQKWVYQTYWMYSVLGILCINLLGVMLDRLPWNRNHIPFIFAHIGIILLLMGSIETQKKGIDGSMRFEIGQSNKFITLPETEIAIYSSFDGDQYTRIFQKDVDFFRNSPKDEPISVAIQNGEIRFSDYSKYALGSKKIIASTSPGSGSAVRFSMTMAQAEVSEWLVQRKPGLPIGFAVGPAEVVLGPAPPVLLENKIFIQATASGEASYTLFYKDEKKKSLQGKLKEGEVLTTGWGGVQLKLTKILKTAEEAWDFQDLAKPTPLTNGVVAFEFKGKTHRLQLNDMVKLFTDEAVFIVTYSNKRLDSGVNLTLDKFEIGRYQGTMRAMAYQSWVTVPDLGSFEISMNEPLKHNGFTFYQASFEEDESGAPRASVLSVNRDPARVEKYLGSLLIVLGSALLFYRRKMRKVDLAKIS